MPARSRNWIGWIRSWTTARVKPEAVIVPKSDTATTTTSTGIAK